MAWRYTFDDGPEKGLECVSSLYMVAAMTAFAVEGVTNLHTEPPGDALIKPYAGHVVKLWDDQLVNDYPPTLYGCCIDQFSNLKIVGLGRVKSKTIV